MEDDLSLQLYSNVDLKNEQNPTEILKFFDKCFFKFGRFPAVSDLAIVPLGVVPSFVKTIDFI